MHNNTTDFSASANWIWAESGELGAWWMFRKAFITAGIVKAELKITANFYFIVYINGSLVARGAARSFHFSKLYDVIDITDLLLANQENVIAILTTEMREYGTPVEHAPSEGLLSEIVITQLDSSIMMVSSNRSWRASRHLSFNQEASFTVGRPGMEEEYDANLEECGWMLSGYDDSSWALARDMGPVGTPPWTGMERNSNVLLSNNSVYPTGFTAIELTEMREGIYHRLSPPSFNGITGITIYVTEVTAAASDYIKLWFKGGAPSSFIKWFGCSH